MEWVIADKPVGYEEAVAEMEARVAAVAAGEARSGFGSLSILRSIRLALRHGTRTSSSRTGFRSTGRGGEGSSPTTARARGWLTSCSTSTAGRRISGATSPRSETWLIESLGAFNVRGERREDRVGVWVRRPDKGEAVEDKIAAIGIRVRRWVTFHGISLNVEPDLSHFSGIVPCGVRRHGVTSLVDLGIPVTMPEVDSVMRGAFERVFGDTVAL